MKGSEMDGTCNAHGRDDTVIIIFKIYEGKSQPGKSRRRLGGNTAKK
jgi:hypothetical protein